MLCAYGDPPRGQSNFVAAPDGFAYGAELGDLGALPGDFGWGSGYPEAHPESADKQRDLEHLQAKVACGADFVTTQLFFDNRDYFDVPAPAVLGLRRVSSLALCPSPTIARSSALPPCAAPPFPQSCTSV